MNTYEILISDINSSGFKSAPRGQEVKELICQDLRVTGNETIIHSKFRNTFNNTTPEGKYLRAEFMWYMSGFLEPDYIIRFGKMWDKLRNSNGTYKIFNNKVNSNYGYHVFWKPVDEIPIFTHDLTHSYFESPFSYVVELLNKDIYSRQAIIQYTLPNIYDKNIKDFTCTQNQQFLVREGNLYNLVHIRSSDAIKGLTFDIPWWDIVGQLLANSLGVDYNHLLVHIGSAHYYERDYNLIDNLLRNNINWNILKLKNKFDMIENLQIVTDSIIEFFTNKYIDSKRTVKILSDYLQQLNSLDNSKITLYENVIPAYLYTAQTFVYLATKYNIETEFCEFYNNMFFDSMFDLV